MLSNKQKEQVLLDLYKEENGYYEKGRFMDYIHSFDEFKRCYSMWKTSSFESFTRFVDYYITNRDYFKKVLKNYDRFIN